MSKKQNKEKKVKKEQDVNEAKTKSKNLEAFRVSMMIYALVKDGVKIDVKKPKKKSEKTFQTHTISRIITENLVIDVEEVKMKEAREHQAGDDSDQRPRRIEKNSWVFNNNILVDVCEKRGFDIGERGNPRIAVHTIQMKRIKQLTKEGICDVKLNEFEDYALAVDRYLKSKFGKDVKNVICDEELVKFVDDNKDIIKKENEMKNEMKKEKEIQPSEEEKMQMKNQKMNEAFQQRSAFNISFPSTNNVNQPNLNNVNSMNNNPSVVENSIIEQRNPINNQQFEMLFKKLQNDAPVQQQSYSFFTDHKFPLKMMNENVQQNNERLQMKFQQNENVAEINLNNNNSDTEETNVFQNFNDANTFNDMNNLNMMDMEVPDEQDFNQMNDNCEDLFKIAEMKGNHQETENNLNNLNNTNNEVFQESELTDYNPYHQGQNQENIQQNGFHFDFAQNSMNKDSSQPTTSFFNQNAENFMNAKRNEKK